MKGQVSRIIALFVLTILITASYLIVIPYHQETLNEEPKDDETYFTSDPQPSRPTRAGTPWPMYLNNPTHTSYTVDIGPTTDAVLWDNSTGGVTVGSPAVVNGIVYIGGGNGMNAFYANNGTLKWRTNTISGVPGGYGVSSSPAVDNGYVFFGGDRLYCLWSSNGSIKWTITTTAGPSASWGDGTPTVANGKVFIPADDRRLYCIEQDTGNVIWTFQTQYNFGANYGLFAPPAVANGLVYLAACDNNLYQINETQPTSIATANHTFTMAYHSYSAPVVANGRVFVGCGYTGASSNNRFYCLDASDLSLIWEFYPGSSTSFFSSAGFYNNRIYIGSVNNYLYCLDAMSSGPSTTVFWQYNIGGTWSSPAITNDRLYIGSKSFNFYCFNLTQPAIPAPLWVFNAGGEIDSSPAVTDGKVYVGSRGSPESIYCFGSLVPPTIDSIKIVNMPGGVGSEITNQFVDVGTVITGYAAAYNGTDWLFDIPVNWSVTNDPSTNASTTPTFLVLSSDFYSGFYGGTVVWTADDGNGHIDNVTFWINPPEVNYIRIVTDEGTGSAEILDDIVDVGYYIQGYAASFNYTVDYIGDIPVTWSVINTSGADGSTTPNFGTNSTVYVGIYSGNVEWIANDGIGHTDSVNFAVNPPEVDHIIIMTGPNGTGSWVGDSTIIYGNTTTFYAGGFNATSGWVEDVSASWISDYPSIGNVSSGPSNSTTFITLSNGSCNITANYLTFTNTTGVLTIINYTVDSIIIRNASNNGGAWVGDRSFNVGETANFFAAAYNSTAPGDGYLGDVSVVWESSDPSIATVTTPGASTLFTAQVLSGECNVTARYGSLITNTTGRLTVLPADIDYILITDAPNGNELNNVYLNVGESIQIFASGYNSTGLTYVGPVNVDWTQSPSSIGDFSPISGTSTIFMAGMAGGSTTIIATHTLLPINDDFTIIINLPTVDYIQIRDTPGGSGNIVTTRTYLVNETNLFYAAAYNITADFLYDVFVMWSSNNTDVGQVTSQGVWTNFTAMHVDLDNTCTVNATLNPLISNSTGPLTVLAPRADYIQIRDESGGEGNVTTTPNFTLGENITDTYYCAAYNHTVGYIGDRPAQWSVTGGIGTISPSAGESTIFTATTAGTGMLRANLTGIINSTGTITVIQVPDTTPPEAPTGLQVFREEGGEALRLTWNENTEGDLAGYNIYRSLSEGTGFELINTEGLVASPSYLDTGLTDGTTYYYKITAVDEASNESPFSDTVHNTPIAEREEDDEEFPMLWILLPIIIIIILILLFLLFKRRKPEKAPFKPEVEKKGLPPPPPWMLEKKEVTTPGEKEEPSEDEIPEEKSSITEDEEIPEEKSPITEDEEIPEDELPPPEDWEEELPRTEE